MSATTSWKTRWGQTNSTCASLAMSLFAWCPNCANTSGTMSYLMRLTSSKMQRAKSPSYLAEYPPKDACCLRAHLWWTTSQSCGHCSICWCLSFSSLRMTLTSGSTSTPIKIMLRWPKSRRCSWYRVCIEFWNPSWCEEPRRTWRPSCPTRSKSTWVSNWVPFSWSSTKSF